MKNNTIRVLLQALVVLLFLSGVYLFIKPEKQDVGPKANQTAPAPKAAKQAKKTTDLPKVSTTDWQLVLVNRDHPQEEMSPELVEINGIPVDKRIEQETADFLAAAQTIEPQEHLIAGYRSVVQQEELYQSYIAQELANDPSLTQEAAEALVRKYAQPAGTSEHQTGLAIDMSTVDNLNASDPKVAQEIQKIAPQFGFILRYPKGKQTSTGIEYEDWHYRYVGKASAQYITAHSLSLEEYLTRLKEKK
ncbi:TPA: D-alanyl-D-alanine carboxypeptidase family protein [Streptococcus equi subsp. zooepidemicus]|uniref:D-alanyl-D-alanine carboxypeptidase n=2 Tax=Streptococcus equi subsp. zooepidemicus TaxID=40041 RepID=A0ABP2XCB9_STRSZ|nr:D-alanyl-D-alanine carboxypeptidase family protein [Streptococcus equi]KIS18911.1 D-alanyl-D-alanine carboxypeptidase [Streptococcus equi subsp. zooepidemicus Sz4is]EQB24228.1 D-alanyl-D-alanine carboxypeptidase [Streptococcus equi subsp. zooepidemicus SzS31A1]KIS08344.1 D-alanyl-D-alanine carboxypeptidase [Streptococcus equi subsp. zooepidemicus Sz12is]MCD3408801.1 D-alanyl-D-alanine carboxypeptidase family protein [Streptococcus equi subsp. zooepidemicus]MCD3446008.1 D-alanyl-D-alanine ca